VKREAQDKTSEADRAAEERLELMPRTVRDKLDRIGLKLHLREWQQLSINQRERLRDLPCTTNDQVAAYAVEVEQLVRRVTGREPERLTPRHP
jgi:hypothetical protein